MTLELLGCLRDVPLWTYGAYLRHLQVLPAVRQSAEVRLIHPTQGIVDKA
jgi:hypothetical protein